MPAVGTNDKSLTSEEVSYMEAAENADSSTPPRATAPQDRRDAQFALRGGKRARGSGRNDIVFGGSGAEVCERARNATATIAKAVPLLYVRRGELSYIKPEAMAGECRAGVRARHAVPLLRRRS
jgi:hypothetical protein